MSLARQAVNAFVDPEVAAAIDAVPNQLNDLGYDPWGFNAEAAKRYFSLGKRFYNYFRPNVVGIENLPAGRVLIVPNHSGQIPLDGLVVAVACLLKAQPPRLVRAMAERWFPTLPWVNIAFSRSGVVVGDPINCKNLLEADNAILVFPEGAKGCGKPFQHRYQLQDFGRGFMRLALQTNTPIVPVGVVGAEEAIISIHNAPALGKLFGMPYAPISPWLPLLGPLAYLPMPVRFHVHFGKPLHFEGPFDDEDSEIDKKVKQVTDSVDALIKQGRAGRKGWFT